MKKNMIVNANSIILSDKKVLQILHNRDSVRGEEPVWASRTITEADCSLVSHEVDSLCSLTDSVILRDTRKARSSGRTEFDEQAATNERGERILHSGLLNYNFGTAIKLALVTLLIFLSFSIDAGTLQETFLQGNAAYQSGNMDAALKLYESIEPKGPAVWYNLGNCYYHLGNYPEAIVHWSRARHDASWRDRITLDAYIAQSYEALGMVQEQVFVMRIYKWIVDIASLCSLLILQLFFLLCFFVLLFLLPRLLKQSRYFIITGLIIVTIFISVACIVTYREQKYPCCIVTKNSISVYAGPGQDYARLTEAKMLDKVRVYEQRESWLKVHLAQFGYGWIAKADLAMI